MHDRRRETAPVLSHHLYSPPSAKPPAPAPSSAPSAFPRAASVTSTRSSTRRHRHARTHHGGSNASLSQNEFPVFSYTGDVEIIIANARGTKENRYVLHRLILSQCSAFFEAGTRVEWSGHAGGDAAVAFGGGTENESVAMRSSSRASSRERRPLYEEHAKQRWRYELDWDAAGTDEVPMLVQRSAKPPTSLFGGGAAHTDRPPPVRNKPPASNEHFFRSLSNFPTLGLRDRPPANAPIDPGDEVLKDYMNLFRCMYNYPPLLDSINIATAYTECKALLHLADMYDALEIVGSRVDHHLLRFGGRLFKQIAKYPPSYLKLGYLARSRTIFTEALIHVVGQWPLAAPQLRGQIDVDVVELLEDKVDELREAEEKVEFRLWRLALATPRGERVTPSSDYLAWLALSLFRQWLADNTTPAQASVSKDAPRSATNQHAIRPGVASSRSSAGGNHIATQRTQPPPPPPPAAAASRPTLTALLPSPSHNPSRIYPLLASGAYLPHDELKRFLRLQPDLYTRDNLRRFERRVDEVKGLAREVVKPLMISELELDLSGFGPVGLDYLSCTRVGEEELPWG